MRTIKISLIAAVGILLVAAPMVRWTLRHAQARRLATVFEGTTAVSFKTPSARMVTVTDPKEVQRLVGALHLTPLHMVAGIKELNQAIFQKPHERVEVSFSDCSLSFWFVKGLPPAPCGYEMPKQFYSEFSKLILNQTNEPQIRP